MYHCSKGCTDKSQVVLWLMAKFCRPLSCSVEFDKAALCSHFRSLIQMFYRTVFWSVWPWNGIPPKELGVCRKHHRGEKKYAKNAVRVEQLGDYGIRVRYMLYALELKDVFNTRRSLCLRSFFVVIVCSYLTPSSTPGVKLQPAGVREEIASRITKARGASANLRHLWCRYNIRPSLNGRVCNATVRNVLLNGCETWPRDFLCSITNISKALL